MSWRDLLGGTEQIVCPWIGGRRIFRDWRGWRIDSATPREWGWYRWNTNGRIATLVGPADADPDFNTTNVQNQSGYAIGDRFARDSVRVSLDPDELLAQTVPIYLVEQGLDRFVRVRAVLTDGHLIYIGQDFDLGPEAAVREAFIDRQPSIRHVKDVTPALELAYLVAAQQRDLVEQRRAEVAARREEERRQEELRRNMGTGAGRRALAAMDFATAARAALAVGGAELLDVRPGFYHQEMIVQYRFMERRLECVCDRRTLRIISSGICLTDHRTGTTGDTWFTLESLPAVVAEAIREHKLVVYRHVDDGMANDGDLDEDD